MTLPPVQTRIHTQQSTSKQKYIIMQLEYKVFVCGVLKLLLSNK